MQASAREAVKLEQYCNIDKWSSSLLGMDTASGCDRDRYWAQLKVLFGMGAVTTGLLLTWCFMSLRAKMESDEITHVGAHRRGRVWRLLPALACCDCRHRAAPCCGDAPQSS